MLIVCMLPFAGPVQYNCTHCPKNGSLARVLCLTFFVHVIHRVQTPLLAHVHFSYAGLGDWVFVAHRLDD